MVDAQNGRVKRYWSSVRRNVRRAGLRVCRVLDGAAPGVTDRLGAALETAHTYHRAIRIGRSDVLTMRVGETRFRLCLAGGSEEAHRVYVPLAREGKTYEPTLIACLSQFLLRLPDPAFMDVGAFMGYFTFYAAALLKDQRPVWAVESNPVHCRALRRAVALNSFTRVQVLQAALSDRPRVVTIDDTAVVPAQERGRRGPSVQAITLDELCAQRSIAPTILKMDVYGAEGMVMRGMSRLLHETIRVVLLELHPVHECQLYSPGFTRAGIINCLERFGFSVYHVAGHRGDDHSGLAAYREQGRFAYLPVTAATLQPLLFDRSLEVLILACKGLGVGEFLGPPVDLEAVVG
jgi:FkbM family methyltransferase